VWAIAKIGGEDYQVNTFFIAAWYTFCILSWIFGIAVVGLIIHDWINNWRNRCK
jgi:hypothetical protein